MEDLHIHEILRHMQKTHKTFCSKEEFASYVEKTFGKDMAFFACSKERMSSNEAYEFLIKKGKIDVQNGLIGIADGMSMCDEG